MRVEFAEQYGVPCLVLDDIDLTENAEVIILKAYLDEATYWDGEDTNLVLQFPGRPMELYTENALRGTLLNKELN